MGCQDPRLATFAANNYRIEGGKGAKRDSTGLPKAKRTKQAATATAPGSDTHSHLEKELEGATEGANGKKRSTSYAARNNDDSASSSCDSSEADLEAQGTSSSARVQS